jgi:hypothetical protein
MMYIRAGRLVILVAACALLLTWAHSGKTAAQQENRRVRVINHASAAIYHFYASNIDSDNWEEDILGEETIPPGGSRIVNIDDGTGHCYYDLKAVLYDDREAVRRKFNVCTEASWTVTN